MSLVWRSLSSFLFIFINKFAMVALLKCLWCCTGFVWDPSRSGFKGPGFKGRRYWVGDTIASEFWRTGLRIFLQEGTTFQKLFIQFCFNWCHSSACFCRHYASILYAPVIHMFFLLFFSFMTSNCILIGIIWLLH